MQAQPDYSKQLEEIAKALSKSSTPSWLVTISTLLIGAVLALGGQLAFKWLENWWKVRRMRRDLYLDMVRLFYVVNSIMNPEGIPEDHQYDWQREQLQRLLRFDVEDYLRDNSEMYFQLPERAAADLVYSYFHQIVEEKKWLNVNATLALQTLVLHIGHGPFQERYFQKFLKRKAADDFLAKVKLIATEREAVLRAMEQTPEGEGPAPKADN